MVSSLGAPLPYHLESYLAGAVLLVGFALAAFDYCIDVECVIVGQDVGNDAFACYVFYLTSAEVELLG